MGKATFEEVRLPAVEGQGKPVSTRGQSESLPAQTAHRLRRSKTALVGLAIVMFFLVMVIFADVLARYRPIRNAPRETFQPPTSQPVLGTDQFGRDMLSRIIYGSRISLAVGSPRAYSPFSSGYGDYHGFLWGKIDTLVMRLMELILAFPVFLLVIILMVMCTSTAGILGTIKVVSAIAIVRIPIFVRLVHGSVLSIKEKEYSEACRAVGQHDVKILFWHILPNCMASLSPTPPWALPQPSSWNPR